ncbi:morphogenesis protein (Msb1) [Hirsutella rhossiliensis]|uniref:Morphogenesis protein (Msb1) n=1 Tax=Hirsutella rhossiliensis TaxID=111463 RepID=A0A9P8MWE1_9HYPO|nr:morphogenesis protein (Msb1) [Hirsutella rhossiliensis]KAH0962500.1 morphogenesis protein (Msb1) [Hirsutella rhossiliensis]
MPGFFSRLKGRDGAKSKKRNALDAPGGLQLQKPKWEDAYMRKTVEPEEIHELLHYCTAELKARGLDIPFLLLPFRPTSNPSAVRTFIRHFFDQSFPLKGEMLLQELRMTEPMVISGVAKWCWSRLQGGVVGWDAYELFKVGEYDSNKARDSFKTFIPISVENGAKQRIIFDFFDLIAAIAAHGKSNGFGGRKLSRMAAWWAFEQRETGSGFDGGYKAWLSAADATSHLFFAYLRSLSPEQNLTGISMLPRSLEKLLKETDYPPPTSKQMMCSTNKLAMVVDAVSPTPFALLRRAGHFQYRDSDVGLQEFASYDDPVKALTEECLRVLKAISAANQSQVSSVKHSTSLRDASWSRFEDIGFASPLEEDDTEEDGTASPRPLQGLRSIPVSGNDMGRPTTPSWADFLSSGFHDDNPHRPNMLLPPDKAIPPLESQFRQHQSSQSHRPRLEHENDLEPGELASITIFELDDAFWWVWMISLAPEETADRKSAFGRCAVIETKIGSARWIVVEEMIVGAAPEPEQGAYIAEKKRFFSWTKRGKTLGRSKSMARKGQDRGDANAAAKGGSANVIPGAETHARIQAKAAQLRAMKDHEQQAASAANSQRRGRTDAELLAEKTNSIFTLQPNIAGEASSAMKWVKKYDKGTIKDAYLANNNAGRGLAVSPVPSDGGPVAGTDDREAGPRVPAKDLSPAPSAPPGSPLRSPLSPAPEPENEERRMSSWEIVVDAGVGSSEQCPSPIPLPKDSDYEPSEPKTSTTSERAKLHKNKGKSGGFRKSMEPPEQDQEPIDAQDAAEADQAFSRFDQGPLTDQPAFVPDDEEDAVPPPIARHPPTQDGSKDRWAQIRKNAAQRAATRPKEDNPPVASGKAAEGEEDVSGEETIESRVARIKARVAELTGGAGDSNGAQAVSKAR